MPKLYIHVGFPKTGTSTIQNFLANNDRTLAGMGWLYPKAARQYVAHHPLGNFFRPDSLDWIWKMDEAQVKADLMAEMSESGCDHVIMSTEALASAPLIEKARDYFAEFEVFIVFFVRRQDQWLESAFQEELKNGDVTVSKADYLETREHWFDYHHRLSNWAQVFGTDHVRTVVFEKKENREAIETQFLDVVGVPHSEEFVYPESKNTSLSRDCLDFFVNMAKKRRIAPRFTLYADILRMYSEKHPDPPEWKNAWSPADRLALLEKYGPSNERVAREFLGIEDGQLFRQDPPSMDDPWEEYPGLTVTEAVQIGEFLADNLLIKLNRK